jgi:maltose O-acetyltransferase
MAGSDERSEKEKMLAGELYRVGPELAADALRADRLLRAYNASGGDEKERRQAILSELLGAVGDGVVVRPPFHCDYGYNIRLGRGTFMNFGCVFLDVAPIVLGEDCQVGPSVQIYAADPPARPRPPPEGLRIRLARAHRQQCLARRRQHHPARGQHRRRRHHRRGKRRDA